MAKDIRMSLKIQTYLEQFFLKAPVYEVARYVREKNTENKNQFLLDNGKIVHFLPDCKNSVTRENFNSVA